MNFSLGRHSEDVAAEMDALVEEKFHPIGQDKKSSRGQILWLRGLSRLQTQVGHVPVNE